MVYILQEVKTLTHIYFVRHAQPDHSWEDDRSRPLTEEGLYDSKRVTEALKDIALDYAISSPYHRSMETIRECVESKGLTIVTDDRLRERKAGQNSNNMNMFRKRWEDLEFHEEDGESIGMVQRRNIEVMKDLLHTHQGESIIVGTHGTALSTILNYYNSNFNCDSFLRIIDYMPYVIRLDFEDLECIGIEEILIIEKVFNGNKKQMKI